MEKYLIDTDVFIEYFKQNQEICDLFAQLKNFRASFVTLGEFLQGAKNKKEIRFLLRFIDLFAVYWGSEEVERLALKILEEYCLSYGLSLADAWQAAVARINNVTLITYNLKHFQNIEGLEVMAPGEILKN